MKRVLSLLLAAAMLGCSSSKAPPVADHAQHGSADLAGHESHSESAQLMVQTDPPAPVAGKPVALKMMIHEADGAMARKFETVHEKLVHLIIVRDGLDDLHTSIPMSMAREISRLPTHLLRLESIACLPTIRQRTRRQPLRRRKLKFPVNHRRLQR